MKDLLHALYALLAPWLAISLLLTGRNPHPALRRIVLSSLLGLLLLLIPISNFPLCRWIALLEPNPSITLTLLLAIALIARAGGGKLFRPQDWRAAWIVGALGSLLLYPMGLGLTSIDPYSWGWGLIIPFATTVLATLLLLSGNRFGIVLLLCVMGMMLHPMESRNSWDALIDPFYAIVSLIMTVGLMFIKLRGGITSAESASPSERDAG